MGMRERRDQLRFRVALVVGVFALALSGFAGIAGLEPPHTPVTPAAGSGPAPGTAAGELASGDALPAVRTEAEVAAPGAAPAAGPRALRVRVSRVFCEAFPHYVGPIVVTAAGGVVANQELINHLPLELVAPEDAETLLFTAPDLLPGELAVGDIDPKRSQSVLLRPREQLQLEVQRPAGAEAATWSFAAQTDAGDSGQVRDKDGDRPCVPFVAGSPFRWQAWLECGNLRMPLTGEEPALMPAERRVLVVDFSRVRTQRYRVDGPSPQLLAYLELRQDYTQGGTEGSVTVPLAADGTCELVPFPGCTFRIEDVALIAEPMGDVVRLRPECPLQGVGLVDAGGAAIRSKAFGRDGNGFSYNKDVHVAARERLQQGVWLGEKFLTAQPVPAEALSGPPDLLLLEAEVGERTTGSLRVRAQGEPPAAELLAKLRLVAKITPEESVVEPAAAEVVFKLPAGATCALHWSLPGCTVAIATAVAVRGGETVDVEAKWPQVAIWTGDVAGFTDLPRERRWGSVAWGEARGFGLFGRGYHVLAGKKDARFELALVDGEKLDPTWHLYWGITPVLARCDVVDVRERRFVVSPAGAVRWVSVAVDAPAPWWLGVARPGVGRPPLVAMTHNSRGTIPVAAGQRLFGCLHGGRFDAGGKRTLAWWHIGDGDDVLRVRPATGRMVELRPQTARANRGAALVGPDGQWDMGCDLTAAAPVSVWVPDGTRGVVVFDGNDAQATAREFPLGAGDFVVVD
ncbi:MAG TPA: hypothetical protein VF384_00640 [Planctomycetota bacterium]